MKLYKYLDARWLEDGYYSFIHVWKYRVALFGNPKDFLKFGFKIEIECVDYKGTDWASVETILTLVEYYGPEFYTNHMPAVDKNTWLRIDNTPLKRFNNHKALVLVFGKRV